MKNYELTHQEPFQIQKVMMDSFKGFFGLSEREKDLIAVGLDAAVLYGIIVEKEDGNSTELAHLKNLLEGKLARIGALNVKPFA